VVVGTAAALVYPLEGYAVGRDTLFSDPVRLHRLIDGDSEGC